MRAGRCGGRAAFGRLAGGWLAGWRRVVDDDHGAIRALASSIESWSKAPSYISISAVIYLAARRDSPKKT